MWPSFLIEKIKKNVTKSIIYDRIKPRKEGFFMDKSKLKELLTAWGEVSETRDKIDAISKNLDEGAEMIIREQYSNYFRRMERLSQIIYSNLTVSEVYFLRLRYVFGICWDLLADKLNYSRMSCFRIHDRILKKLYTVLQKSNFEI